MGEAVECVERNLHELVVEHSDMIKEKEWREEMEYLEKNVRILKEFLMKKREEEEEAAFNQIREFVYEMDDVIDSYVTEIAIKKSRTYFPFSLSLSSSLSRTRSIINHTLSPTTTFTTIVQSLRERIQLYTHIIRNFNTALQPARQSPKLVAAPIREVNLMGLKEETETLIRYLSEESEEVDVITIVGMPGIGKTTLAWKAFISHEVIYDFPTRIWVNVSDEFTEKEVFLDILKQITSLTGTAHEGGDINGKDDKELAGVIATFLEKEKFLIVMDGVWSANDWDRLRVALPKHSKQGKVLITSCDENVGGRDAKRSKVKLLTPQQSWSLLKSEVFGDEECPSELEPSGKLIANQCDGLPLAILAMSRTLVKQNSIYSDMSKRKIAWKNLCSRLPEFSNDTFYGSLPYHLRPCFLYFGMFPYDEAIPVWKLIHMWIAEGFIQHSDTISLEDTAETYLRSLIDRNLVISGWVKRNGKVKTCYIHRMLHEFCKTEAAKQRENFLQQINFSDGGNLINPPIPDLSTYHRLCIESNLLTFLSSEPSGPRVRSLVSFSGGKETLSPENCSTITAGFKLLRVLNVPIRFTKIPSDLYELVHLRFLALSFDSAILPAKFSKLWNLQTLLVDTTSRTLEIKADLWELTKLRHFKTNASATLAKPDKSSKRGENLQTLDMISPESCTDELCDRARNLKKLGIRGRLSLFFDGKIGSSDSLRKLSHLETLILLNDVYPKPPSDGKLSSLPPAYQFPPRLRSLTLSSTQLDWSKLSVLASLERLEMLKLKHNAFMGRDWVIEDGGFNSLEVLHIEETDLVVWVASSLHFPRLTRLELRSCEKLREVPIQLADIPSFQHLDLYHTKLAAASAIRIGDEIKTRKHDKRKPRDFKLSIFPPVK